MQKALQMGGAPRDHLVMGVPDAAKKGLMLDFDRRLWVEQESERQALRDAQTKPRGAKDQRGAPECKTRAWAAWAPIREQRWRRVDERNRSRMLSR